MEIGLQEFFDSAGLVTGSQPLGQTVPNIMLTSPSKAPLPLPFATPAPLPFAKHHITLLDNFYYPDRQILVDFPTKTVVNGIRVMAPAGSHAKEIKISYKHFDYVQPDTWSSLGVITYL